MARYKGRLSLKLALGNSTLAKILRYGRPAIALICQFG